MGGGPGWGGASSSRPELAAAAADATAAAGVTAAAPAAEDPWASLGDLLAAEVGGEPWQPEGSAAAAPPSCGAALEAAEGDAWAGGAWGGCDIVLEEGEEEEEKDSLAAVGDGGGAADWQELGSPAGELCGPGSGGSAEALQPQAAEQQRQQRQGVVGAGRGGPSADASFTWEDMEEEGAAQESAALPAAAAAATGAAEAAETLSRSAGGSRPGSHGGLAAGACGSSWLAGLPCDVGDEEEEGGAAGEQLAGSSGAWGGCAQEPQGQQGAGAEAGAELVGWEAATDGFGLQEASQISHHA